MRYVILLSILLNGCAASWSWGPATWGATPPAIPGFTPIPLGGGGFIEEPDSLLTGGAGAQPPAPPPPTEIETVITGMEQAQKVRTLTRQLAR